MTPARTTQRRILYTGLTALVVGQCLLVAAADRPAWGVLAIAPGMALVMLAWQHHRLAEPAIGPPVRQPRSAWRFAWLALSAALALWLTFRLTESTAGFGLFLPTGDAPLAFLGRPPGHTEQAACWLLSMALFVLGCAGLPALPAGWTPRIDRGLALRLAALFALALALRLVNLEDGVPVLFVDEAAFAAQARDIATGISDDLPIFAPGHYSHPLVFAWAVSPFVTLLGPTRAAARLLPALAGALTVPAVYWLAAELVARRRVALAAALFLAVYPVHIHFSRMALNNAVDPLFGTLAFAALLRGLRRGRAGWFALAGVMLGLSQHFYAAARALPLLALILLAALLVRQPRALRATWRGLAAALAGFVIATLPMHVYLFAHRLPLTSRVMQSFDQITFLHLTASDILSTKLVPAALGYVHTPDGFYFYGGETPLLLFLPAVLFLLGMAHLLVNWRTTPGFLLLTGLALPTAASAFLIEVPGFARLVLATPLIAIVAALGVDRLADAARTHGARRTGVLAAALLAAVAVGNVTYYFGAHLPAFEAAFSERQRWMQAIGARARTLPHATNAVFLGDRAMTAFMTWSYRYYNGDGDVIWAHDAPQHILPKLEDEPAAFVVFFIEDYKGAVQPLIAARPDGELAVLPTPPEVRPVYMFYVPAQPDAGDS
ncbi:MAG: glycosyltransferase family 39 protein [Anaerolineae bacterium]|nr:glycosyltransferase family 39 protein [Anaerolineae bacterium]